MKEFKTYHPLVNLTYFLFVIIFSCFLNHPVCLLISLVCAFLYSVMLKGKKAIKNNLSYMLPMMLLLMFVNPLFNHQGATILAYFPSGNPLTMESVIYGIMSSLTLASVICWFSCYNEVMTSDKFIYLFGRIIPSMSLVLSMTLRFVPRFISQFKTVISAQRCIGRDILSGTYKNRFKNVLSILSSTVTWAFENSIQTSDSMKSRGYGLKGRSAYLIYTLKKRDKINLVCIFVLGIYILVMSLLNTMYITYFPTLSGKGFSPISLSAFLAYLILCIYPVIIEIMEVRRWKSIK